MSDPIPNAPPAIQCVGKERYATPQLAHSVAVRRMASQRYRTKAPRTKLNTYACPHCGHWHLGRLS